MWDGNRVKCWFFVIVSVDICIKRFGRGRIAVRGARWSVVCQWPGTRMNVGVGVGEVIVVRHAAEGLKAGGEVQMGAV